MRKHVAGAGQGGARRAGPGGARGSGAVGCATCGSERVNSMLQALLQLMVKIPLCVRKHFFVDTLKVRKIPGCREDALLDP